MSRPSTSSSSSNSGSSTDVVYSINSEAFAFLTTCAEAKFDFTSAEPPKPKSTGILPPSRVVALMQQPIDFDDLAEVKGQSRGDETTLTSCVEYFHRSGVTCDTTNISLNESILLGMEKAYSRLGLPNSDKRILVIAPTFGFYLNQFQRMNINYDIYSTSATNNYLPEEKTLQEALVRTKAKAILLCYPNNPTGTVMTEDCARMIYRVTKEHGVFVISDEAFGCALELGKKRNFSFAAVDGAIDRSITVTSVAKAMLFGGKTAFCVGPKEFMRGFLRLGGYPTLKEQRVMTAAIADNDENREYLEKVRAHYLGNTELIEKKLEELNEKFGKQFGERNTYAKLFIARPESTNVLLLDFSGLRGMQHQREEQGTKTMETGLDVAEWLLKDASVAMVPGECFLFDPKQMLVRVTLNDSRQQLEQAFDKIIAATKSISFDNSRSQAQESLASDSAQIKPPSFTSCRGSSAIPLARTSAAQQSHTQS